MTVQCIMDVIASDSELNPRNGKYRLSAKTEPLEISCSTVIVLFYLAHHLQSFVIESIITILLLHVKILVVKEVMHSPSI